MAIGQADQTHPTPLAADRRALWGRRLAVGTAIVFCISAVFPAAAGFVRDTESWPKWWGVLDVSVAFLLAILTFAVLGIANDGVNKQAEEASYRAYRILAHGILAGLVSFFVLGDRIIWSQCLTGFAWRTWLLLYSLPAWITAFSGRLDARGNSDGNAARIAGY